MFKFIVELTQGLVLLWISSSLCATGQSICNRIVTEPCELRWSSEKQEFNAKCGDIGGDTRKRYTPSGDKHGPNIWCISNRNSAAVQIRIYLLVERDMIEMENCPSTYSRDCAAACVVFDTSDRTDVSARDTVFNLRHVKVQIGRNLTLDETDSYSKERVTRLTRQANHIPSNITPPTRYRKRKRRRQHRKECRRCKYRRKRTRRNFMRQFANEFLVELAKEADRLQASNHTSLTRLLRHNSKLSSQFETLRNYDVKQGRTPPPSLLHSRNEHPSEKAIRVNSQNDKRFRRDPGTPRPFQSDKKFCGVTSRGVADAKPLESTRTILKDGEGRGRWTAPTLPLALRVQESKLLLNVTDLKYINVGLLKHLVISVEFIAATQTSSSPVSMSAMPYINSTVSVRNKRRTETAISVVCGGVGFLIITFMVIVVFLRISKVRRVSRCKSRGCDCRRNSESENCLSSAGSVEDDGTWKTSSVCSNERGVRELSRNETIHETNIVMLEQKKCKRERNKDKIRRSSARSTTEASDGLKHPPTCQHAVRAEGSSRHEHCIVCQIAGKPHTPIVDAEQYASRVLPTAKRYAQGAVGTTLGDNSSSNSTSSLPWTVRLPDGEERYRGGQGKLSSLMSPGGSYQVCIRAPPNRTIFSCDSLPFAPFNNNSTKTKVRDYPGPPSSSVPKLVKKDCTRGIANGRGRIPVNGNHYACRCLVNQMDDPPPEYSDVVS